MTLKTILFGTALALATVTSAQMADTAKPAKAPKAFKLLYPADVAPSLLLAAPYAKGSAEEAAELAEVRRIVTTASPARLAQARRDDEVEDPSIFDATIGGGFEAKKLPMTWALLRLTQNEADRTADLAKKRYARIRPWGIDPTLPNCDAGKGKSPLGSYPSGHSSLGYSVAPMLAMLLPDHGDAIHGRARDYAMSRIVCGVHFASDTEASHVIGASVATRLMTMPQVQIQIAAARAELRKAGFAK